MPVDLKQLGPSKPYPPGLTGIRVWLGVWIACVVAIDGAIVLLWPQGRPARDVAFWLPVAGLPNVLFLMILILIRAGYENTYLHTMYFNDHRDERRRGLIERGQRAVCVLGYSYQLPVVDGTLARTIVDGVPLLKAQPPREGIGTIRHTRLPDHAGTTPTDPLLAQTVQQLPLDRTGTLYVRLLASLAGTLRLLLQAGLTPAVRLVVADPARPGDALKQLHTAIRVMNLHLPDCKTVSDHDGLMPVDAWLDAEQARPLLLIALQLHDNNPPEDSAEGGVALLVLREGVVLPDAITPCATLHRPVAVPIQELSEGLALTLLWGRVTPAMLDHAWLAGFDAHDQTHVTHACRRVALDQLTKFEARRSPDHILGHAGRAAGWLAIAAAAEHGADSPQLILNRTTAACQAAILQAHPRKQ